MKVSDAMSREVAVASPTESIRNAAKVMAKIDAGVLPVGEGDQLIGMITDRDIVTRVVAEGCATDGPVRDVMTPDVAICHEDDETDAVATRMSRLGVRRMPVLDSEQGMAGMVALSDFATRETGAATQSLLDGTARSH